MTVERAAHGLVLCVACLLLTACASASSDPPGLRNVRQVVLIRENPPFATFPTDLEMLAALSRMATDRFNAQQTEGYVNVVFSNPDSHLITVALQRQTGENIYIRTHDIEARPQFWQARGVWVTFPIRGRLVPGRYVM